ncbi:VWA domain-containing protein [Coraliomargarita parva]|uniref:VWA domain-containing protein n=1 Tax=Coraliomargarita parva TaxID=3014050 RepID=UPI0022B4C733|nr:VWA domain-containing protein [Coraliomargarita parva]
MKRREAQSSALSFMDCICCGFGAVLLLFILTAKQQIVFSEEDASQALEAAQTLHAAIEQAEARQKALDKDLSALDPQPGTNATSLAELAAEQERLAKAIEAQAEALEAVESETESEAAGLDRPSADQSYLSGLQLRAPRVVILLENSGSMLAPDANEAVRLLQSGQGASSDKWKRAKAAVRTVLASIPQGTQVAIFQMNLNTSALSGSPANPYFDPYDNAALLGALEQLDRLEASGGADLSKAVQTVSQLNERPSSLLLIADGLPTAPAAGGSLSEADRVRLFNSATSRNINYPFNTILLPFEGDPSAAGLFWGLSGRTNGITLIPDEDWPSI